MQQWQHRQTLKAALLGDDEHDPEWPTLAAELVPDNGRREGTVQGTWCVLVSQRARIRRQAWDEGVSEGEVLRRVLAEHFAKESL
jgi:hypothetical protein